MIRAVAKHSYIKSGSKGTGRAKAHVNYVQYRSGEDRGKGPREFFDGDREHVLGREVKQRIDEQEQNGVLVHKLILSPGIQDIDLEQYTRETMESLSREKGQELEWYGIPHKNTEHDHVHVVVMGHDKNGGMVWIDKDDHKLLRDLGDRYLEREHQMERYLDKEIFRLLKEPTREIELEYKRGRGDKDYERWMHGDERDKRNRGDAERDRRDWEKLDEDLHKSFSYERGLERTPSYKQYQRQESGRLLGFHEGYENREAKERWEELAKQDPELAQGAERELQWLEDLAKEQGMDRYRGIDLDHLIDGKDPLQRAIDKEFERDKDDPLSEFQFLLEDSQEPDRSKKSKEQTIDDLLGFTQEREEELEKEPTKEPELGDAWQTFEVDRQTITPEDPEQEREDHDRGDDMFGR